MSRLSSIFLVVLMLTPEVGWARRRVPLMPSRYDRVSYASPRPVYYSTQTAKHREPTRFGLELGFLTRRNSTEGGALGMQWMNGGRIVMDYAWNYRWHLKPSFGYFFRNQGEASTSVSEHNFELGASLLYDLSPDRKSTVMIGLANRIDGLLSTITVFNSSDSVPLTFRYRVGPQANFLIGVTRDTYLTLGLEVPVEVPDFRIFSSMTAGFLTRF